jgi:hypothetical protein
MPYRMLEELQNRRKEKVAIFLTFENIVGLILVFFPVFVASSSLPLLIRGPLCITAAVLGVALTLDVEGLPVYAHALWRVRGTLRLRTNGSTITPDDLASTIARDAPERPLPLDGPIQAATDRAGAAGGSRGIDRGDRRVPGALHADTPTQ